MSNTIVTDYSNASGVSTKSDKSLVIIVNKDGSVALEKEAIKSLLETQYESTSVSIVRMNDDGKPDDASDHSSDESIPHINLTVDAFFNSAPNKDFEKDSQNEYISDLFGSELPLIGFQNDHCYTPLTSPSQSRCNSETENVHVKEENDVYSPNVQKQYIPSSKKITVLENKIIAKGKGIQYFNTGNAREILKGSDILKRPIVSSANIVAQIPITKKIDIDKNVKDGAFEAPSNKKTLENYPNREDANEDRDSESEYLNLSDDIDLQNIVKSKSLLRRDVKKILSQKIGLKNNGALNSPSFSATDHSDQNRVKRVSKTYNRIVEDKMKSTILLKSDTVKTQEMNKPTILNVKLSTDSEAIKHINRQDSKTDILKTQKPVLKKDKKPPAHMTALLNDMTSLFSSPDVIRRVSTETKQSSKPPEKILTNSLLKKSDHPMSFATVLPEKNIDPLYQNKLNTSKSDLKTYSNTSSKMIPKESPDGSSRRNKIQHQKETLDVIPSLDDVSLAQLLQDPTAGILSPVNMPLVLNTVPVQGAGLIEKHDNSSSNGVLMGSVPSLNAPLSPSLDILAGLQTDEEGLTEDLLRHVAQLVESSENLQEVIDKQVLGNVPDIPPKEIHKLMSPLVKTEPLQNQMLQQEQPQSSNLIKKEPIQIVRSNGRVITLPPIEAPATRSSKRKSLLNNFVDQPASTSASLEVNKVLVSPQGTIPKQPVQPSGKQAQRNVDPGSVKSSTLSQMQYDKRDDDAESDESWNSEDDPDRLWCICKQPHNNRFMICCDLCEDWFHGKCVNVTKAMGQEMEEKGVEWRCPNCLKKKAQTNPPLKTTPLRKSIESKLEPKLEERSQKTLHEMGPNLENHTNCIVCKRPARASSIYCSDACIQKHAQESLIIASPPSIAQKNVKDTPNKIKSETRVIVYERKSGKFLAGPSAPTPSNLKTWLQEHPTYEVVRPGTVGGNKQATPPIKMKPKPNLQKVQSILTIGQDKQVAITQPALKSPTLSAEKKLPPKPTTPVSTPSLKSPPTLNKTQLLKQPLKSPTTPKTPVPQAKPPLKSPTTPVTPRRDESTPRRSSSTEPIRDNVRKALQEQISLRMTETKDVRFTHEEIAKFANDTEFELHDLFKDAGTKYKAKYRSLMFNLKDRKNLTLWQKICDRSITPKQLVRLSPEELASQELAQWRNKEAKHQLELIKKSELDLLSCNKTYVLKTHKGEEVMETRTTATTELDPNVSVEDLVSALNKSVDGAGSVDSNSKPPSPATSHEIRHSSSHHKHSSRHKSKSHKSSKTNNKNNHSSDKGERSQSKHRSSKETKVDTRSRHRRSSKDRSDRRDRSSRHRSQNTRRSSDSRSKSVSKQSESEQKRSVSRDKRRSSSSSKDDFKNQSLKEFDKEDLKLDSELIKLEDIKSPVLYDDKLNSQSGEKSPDSDSLKSPETPDIAAGESDQEPTSTVDSFHSAVWSGCVNMIDVARFNVSAHEVSGLSDDVIYDLESELDVVGRISPETVWDYINKMKKQGSKDILILRLVATTEDEKIQYMALYTYLSSRSRLGVVKVGNGGIKDFYILPLPSHSTLPSVLLPLHGPGFEDVRPNLLLGIIVKQRRKRMSQISNLSSIPSKVAKIAAGLDRTFTPPTEGSYTPPSSPRRKPILSSSTVLSGMPLPSFMPNLSTTVKDKIAASLASADDDEPYSPGGSDSGSFDRSRSPPAQNDTSVPTAIRSAELQKKMEELNRKIEEEKKQIETISKETLEEPYSPSRPMSPPATESTLPMLSNISLPSNLQEILASIQKKTNGPVSEDSQIPDFFMPSSATPLAAPFFKDGCAGDVDMRVLNPPSFAALAAFQQTPAESSSKNLSKLSSLSEAELLSMVPDGEGMRSTNNPVFPPLPVNAPPLPITDLSIPPPPYKRQKVDYAQPTLDENL